MSEGPATRSLLPYLDRSGRGVYLEIPLTSKDPAYLERQDFPFRVVDASHPLFRIIEARFRSDAGSSIRNVFLIVQKDTYMLPREALRPTNNIDIEAAWLRAFAGCTDSSCRDAPIFFSSQFDRPGRPVPLNPLFFCKRGAVFFHPPCPSCGSPLEECRSDNLLGRWDLPAYSTSTSRFLFCPSCSLSREEGRFFAFRMEGWEIRGIEDWRGLAREYDRLRKMGLQEAGSPCRDCSRQSYCGTQEGFGEADFVPFSFYPFFQMIHEAMSCNALDFLALISDASFRDVRAGLRKDGRIGRLNWIENVEEALAGKQCFLFRGEKRHFLEILYLKLSFLDEFIRTEPADGTIAGYPGWRPSLDRVWVKVAGQAAHLPHFWNFSLRRIDVVEDVSSLPSPLFSASGHARHFLGLVWFYALLRNEAQGAGRVYEALRAFAEESPTPWCGSLKTEAGSVFRPQNVFWNPGDRSVDESWHPLWSEALQLGLYLLRPGPDGHDASAMAAFRERLAALQEAIGKELFEGRSTVQPVETGRVDETICGIIGKLRDRWGAATGLEAVSEHGLGTSSQERPLEGDGMPRIEEERRPVPAAEAVSGDMPEAAGPQHAEEKFRGPTEEYPPLPETLILRDGEVKARPSVEPVAASVTVEEIPETLILSSVKEAPVQRLESGYRPSSRVEEKNLEGPLLPETAPPEEVMRPVSGVEEEALPETVLIGARSGKNARKEEKK